MPSVVWLLVVVFAAMVCITTLLLLLVHREDPDALQSIVFPERPSQTPSPSTAPLPSPLPLTSPLQMAVHPPTRPTPSVSVSWQPQLVTSAVPPPLPLPPPDAASRELQQREEELLEAEARLAWKSSLGHVSAVEGQRPWRALPDAGSTLSTAWALGTSASAFVSVSPDESGAWPATPPHTPAHALPRAPASPPMEGCQAAGGGAWTPGPRWPSETDPDAPDPPPWGETLSTVVALHTAAEPDAASQMTLSPSSSASSSASPSTESAIMSLVSDAASMAVSLAPATPPPTPATGVSVVGTSHAGPRPPTAEWSSTAAAAIAMAAHAPASSPLSERPSDASAGPGSAFAPALRPVGASVSWASAGRPAPPDAEASASTSAFDSASSDAASGSAREAPVAQPVPPPTPPPPSRRSPRGALAALAAPTASTAPTASGDLAPNAALASPAAGDQGAPAGFTSAMQALRGELESTERECERLRRHIAFISATRAALRRDVEAARAAPAHVDGDVGVASEGLASEGLASEGLVGEGMRRRLRLRARPLLPLPSASPLCLADPPDHQ